MSDTIEVKKTPDGKWGVYVNEELFGVTKHNFAARFAARLIFKAADCAELIMGPQE